ncbi:hypothetical protein BKG79_17180 [Mycobacteroides chelonae]|nr:hypothetical protein BKG79_17180 [Mycobacteroides chelonae]
MDMRRLRKNVPAASPSSRVESVQAAHRPKVTDLVDSLVAADRAPVLTHRAPTFEPRFQHGAMASVPCGVLHQPFGSALQFSHG